MEIKNQLVQQFVIQSYHLKLSNTLKRNRSEFQKLDRALRARTGNKKETLFDNIDFDLLFRALPIWLVTSSEISNTLPLYKELFDIVIIDEATQCDIASSLPLIFRAKKIVIVGDPKQLRHISFISNKRQEYLIKENHLAEFDLGFLNYRENSLLDVVSNSINSQEQVHFLDEHYRSMPDIIAFSNKSFYENALKVMTESPVANQKKHLELIVCEGKRNKSGYNRVEMEQILQILEEIIEKEKKLADHLCQSIGILSPFREQVAFIQKQVQKSISLSDIERHRLLVGTPYSFQGEERDVVFLSFAIDGNTHPSTFQYLNRTDVLNVAITRARMKQYVLISLATKELKKLHLFSQYILSIRSMEMVDSKNDLPEQQELFLKNIRHVLRSFGISEIMEGYQIAGLEIDILVIYEGKSFGIDLIGFPGKYERAFPIERYRLLNRIGMKVIVIPYSRWLINKKEVAEMIRNALS